MRHFICVRRTWPSSTGSYRNLVRRHLPATTKRKGGECDFPEAGTGGGGSEGDGSVRRTALHGNVLAAAQKGLEGFLASWDMPKCLVLQ